MTLFELQQDHAALTKAYYEDKILTKEAFDRAHLINALNQRLLSDAKQEAKDEAQSRLDVLLG